MSDEQIPLPGWVYEKDGKKINAIKHFFWRYFYFTTFKLQDNPKDLHDQVLKFDRLPLVTKGILAISMSSVLKNIELLTYGELPQLSELLSYASLVPALIHIVYAIDYIVSSYKVFRATGHTDK
jgi:hypothetical protein